MNIQSVISQFELARNESDATYMSDYMKGQFRYFGIKTKERRMITKTFIKKAQDLKKGALKALVSKLYQQPEREFHHVALDICILYFKKQCSEDDIDFFEDLAKQNQWWDTLDVIAPKLMGHYFMIYPQKRADYIEKWLKSGDKWLVRCALLFQLKYKMNTDLGLLFETILRIPSTNEFFINKAIGWILRENTHLFPEAVVDFVRDNNAHLSNLSKKEALRLLK